MVIKWIVAIILVILVLVLNVLVIADHHNQAVAQQQEVFTLQDANTTLQGQNAGLQVQLDNVKPVIKYVTQIQVVHEPGIPYPVYIYQPTSGYYNQPYPYQYQLRRLR